MKVAKNNKSIKFALVADEKTQVIEISEEAVDIVPEMEPEAEISIPKKAFESPCQLELKVWNYEAIVNKIVYIKKLLNSFLKP